MELKPCPFCGREVKMTAHKGAGWYEVECIDCEVDVRACGLTEERAAMRWNMRLSPQSNPEVK